MRSLVVILATVMLLGCPVGGSAQPDKVHRIGVLVFADPASPDSPTVRSVLQGLGELGYVNGKNVDMIVRSAEGRVERLPGLVGELLEKKVDVLVAGSTQGALAAKKGTTTVPIVFAGVLDPVGSGVVAALARPGANLTGVTVGIGGEGFTGKCLALLREAVPGLSHVAVLVNPSYPLSVQFRREVQAASRPLNMTFDVREAANARDLERALTEIGGSKAQGMFVAPDPFLTGSSARIAQFALGTRRPALHFSKRFAEAGGLMSYGGTLDESYRRAAAYVDKILKGARPADLPVEQPTRFELVINVKTAKALGLTIPPSLLLRADHVID